MTDLQERLVRAGNLAKLQSLIRLTRGSTTPTSQDWPVEERRWFMALLSPFETGPEGQRSLGSVPTALSASEPPSSTLVSELMRTHTSTEDLVREVRAIVSLLSKLIANKVELNQDDARRVHDIAAVLRKRLLEEQSFVGRFSRSSPLE